MSRAQARYVLSTRRACRDLTAPSALAVGGLVMLSCGNPVERCQEAGLVDCCQEDDDCVKGVGPLFPYCFNPGPQTGQCVECVFDSDCAGGQRCLEDDDFGPYCGPDV